MIGSGERGGRVMTTATGSAALASAGAGGLVAASPTAADGGDVLRGDWQQRLAHVVDWLLGWCSDLARTAAGASPQENNEHAATLRRLATSVAPIRLFRYHRSLLRQRGLIAHPLAPRLVAEALLTDYQDLFR